MSSTDDKPVYSPSVCGLCKTPYTRLSSLNDHYNSKQIRKRGKLVTNPCYQADKRYRFKSVQEASEAEKNTKIENYFERLSSKKAKLDKNLKEIPSESEVPGIENSFPILSKLECPSTSAIVETSSTQGFDEMSLDISIDDMQIKSSNLDIQEVNQPKHNFIKEFREVSLINENIDAKLNIIIEKEDCILSKIDNLKISDGKKLNEKTNSNNSEIVNDDCFKSIRMAKSIDDIMKNRLVQDIFEIVTDEIEHISKLHCKKCETNPNTRDAGIIIKDTEYDSQTHIGKQKSWFVNMKSSLLKHVKKDIHIKSTKDCLQTQTNVTNIKTDIMKAMINLSNFAIKSELSF